MMPTPRQRFLAYVRNPELSPRVVSPFLPDAGVVSATLASLGLPGSGDPVANEIALSRHLGYEPMFMTECSGLIFDWTTIESRSSERQVVQVIPTAEGEWVRHSPRVEVPWSDESGCPVQTLHDHDMLVAVCREVESRATRIRAYFREWRERVGENGVIVLGHPHPAWLGYQINPSSIFYHWQDYREAYIRSMDAVFHASVFVMSIAVDEGIDFMSDSSYGLEMTSPSLFADMDLPYIRAFAQWTKQHGGLFWYHNCGHTRSLISSGMFNTLGADVIETLAPPPEGDNELAESRAAIDRTICTKGNLNLQLLRDGTPAEIAREVRRIAGAVRGYPHIISTADAVLPGTPPENFIAFVNSARETTVS